MQKKRHRVVISFRSSVFEPVQYRYSTAAATFLQTQALQRGQHHGNFGIVKTVLGRIRTGVLRHRVHVHTVEVAVNAGREKQGKVGRGAIQPNGANIKYAVHGQNNRGIGPASFPNPSCLRLLLMPFGISWRLG